MNSPVNKRFPLVIVGGGAAAAWTLILIKRALGHLPETLVVEPREKLGLGLAYSATLDVHRLNVTAEKMDLFPEPDVPTFGGWVEENSSFSRTDYVPRSLYGRYLNDLLRDEMAGQPLFHRQTTVTSITIDADDYSVFLATGEIIHAEHVIMALGNPASRSLGDNTRKHVVDDPSGDALEAVSGARNVLVVGAGLTSIDVVLECEKIASGRHYTIVAPHPYFPPGDKSVVAVEYDGQTYPSPSGLWKWVKINRGSAKGLEDWYAPVDGLRSHVSSIWQSWSAAQRKTFLRHSARYWLHLRHRAPPASAKAIAELESNKQLTFVRGRARILSSDSDGVEVSIAGTERRFDCVVNATGPNLDPRSMPLLVQMLDAGLIRADPLGLGVDVGSDGRAVAPNAGNGLFFLGTWTRGSLWEVTAVPHIRESIRALLPSFLADQKR